MSDAAIDDLAAAGGALRRALHGKDAAHLARATEAFRSAVARVGAAGGWHVCADHAGRLGAIRADVELLTLRVEELARVSARRLALLERLGARAGRGADDQRTCGLA